MIVHVCTFARFIVSLTLQKRLADDVRKFSVQVLCLEMLVLSYCQDQLDSEDTMHALREWDCMFR